MERPSTVTSVSPKDSSSARRSGFTLVELLAVIMIIALLAALVTPAVMRARTSARNAAIKAEIDMLHMAIMNYKNDYGSFPPAVDLNPGTASTPPTPAQKHLQRLFPRCANVVGQFSAGGAGQITPINALASWLLGFTGDPSNPLLPPANRKKLFDFDQTRINASTGGYAPAGKSLSPYIYMDYASYAYCASNPVSVSNGTMTPELTAAGSAFNPDTFQILCAGQDETWGTDDDLSNFWKGTRKEYLDSLKQ